MRVAWSLATIAIAVAVTACDRNRSAVNGRAGSPAEASIVAAQSNGLAYVCPMDRDVRSNAPGKCPRCGMELVAGIPDLTEYHLDLSIEPRVPHANEVLDLRFQVFDPWKNNRVQKFSIVHEKFFHAFIVSRDLEFFEHDHPTWDEGTFHLKSRLPRPGMYRILADFYPEASTPQLLTETIFVPGSEMPPASLRRDDSPRQADNMQVALMLSPPTPIARSTTQMRFEIAPADGVEKYLGAWGHMLAVSDDLVDIVHTHPRIADGGPQMQFSLVFPRHQTYRVWVQFQRRGVVNTAHFDIPVLPAESPSAS